MTRVQGAERQLVLDLRPRPATPSASASQAPASVSDLETPEPELDAVADDATTRAETERFLADVPASALRCDDLAWAVIERRRVLVVLNARPPTPRIGGVGRPRFLGRLGRFRGPHVHRRARDRRVRARLARGAHVARGETLQTRDRRHRAATQRPRREMGRVPGYPGGGGRPLVGHGARDGEDGRRARRRGRARRQGVLAGADKMWDR